MQSVTATIRNGRVELPESVDWPDGTQVQVSPMGQNGIKTQSPMTEWPQGFFDQLREDWGDEPFERPTQGDSETREDW